MLTATACVLLLAAAPAGPTVFIEFDGKGGQNPSATAAGVLTATGTFSVPAGCEFTGVELEVTKRHPGPGPAVGRMLRVTVDTTVKPHKWAAANNQPTDAAFEPGDYLVRAVIRYSDKGSNFWDETWELRKVRVPGPAK